MANVEMNPIPDENTKYFVNNPFGTKISRQQN